MPFNYGSVFPPINPNGSNVSFNFFIDNFVQICNQQQANNLASAFCLIVYDIDNVNLVKVVQDAHYWNALSKISDNHLTIFSLLDTDAMQGMGLSFLQESNGVNQYLLTPAYLEKVRLTYQKLYELFFDKKEYTCPSILFFQIEGECIIDYFHVELEEQTIEKSYIEIKNIITEATETIKRITPENRKNYKEIFDMIKTNINLSVNWNKDVSLVKKMIKQLDLLSIFK